MPFVPLSEQPQPKRGFTPAEGEPNIVGRLKDGRPVVLNEDGSVATHIMSTVTNPAINGGQPTNVPTMYGGRRYSAQEAEAIAARNGGIDPDTGAPFAVYPTIDEAEVDYMLRLHPQIDREASAVLSDYRARTAQPSRGFTPLSQAAPALPADPSTTAPALGSLGGDAAAARPATLPEARAVEPSLLDRIRAGFVGHENLSQNLGDLLADSIPRVDPATGRLLTGEERRAERLAFEARRVDALGVDPPSADFGIDATRGEIALATARERGQQLAELLGVIGKEASDPIALMTGPVGATDVGLARLAKLAVAGGAYETLSALVDQVSDRGKVTDPGEVALRGAAGAVATPALDALIRGVGLGVRKLLEQRRARLDAGASTEEVDAQIREGVAAVAEEADKAGVSPADAQRQLIEVVQSPEGDVGVPRRDVFDSSPAGPAAEDAPPPGFTPVAPEPAGASVDAVPPVPAAAPAPAPAPASSVNYGKLAEEYARLARATDDPVIRTELLGKADAARAEAEGAKPKLTPKQRADAARRVNPAVDSLDIAIRKMGGIDTARETDWEGRLKGVPRMFGLGALERPGKGQTLDSLAERLYELGYLREYNQTELADLLGRVERGEKVYSMEAPAELRVDVPEGQSDNDFTFHESAVSPSDINTDFVIDTDTGTVAPARPIDFEDLRRLDEEERNAAEYFNREAGVGPAEQSGGLPGARGAGIPERLAGEAQGRPGNQSGQAAEFRLDSYSADELRAELERRAALEGNADAARRADEARAQADRERSDFILTGSDRLADANPAQRDLMDFARDERNTPTIREPSGGDAGTPDAGRRDAALASAPEQFTPTGEPIAERVAPSGLFGPRVAYRTTGKLPTSTRTVNAPDEVAHLTAQLRKEPQESVLAVVTDESGNVLRVVRHSVGLPAQSQVDPALVAGAAHTTPGARNLWVVHQHPSGDPAQSNADHILGSQLVENLRDTGIDMRGMVVVAPGGRYSFAHADPRVSGQVRGERIPGAPRRDSVDVSERRFSRVAGDNAEPIVDFESFKAALERHSGGQEGVLLMNNQRKPVGFVPMRQEDMVSLRQGKDGPAAELYRAIDQTNAMETGAIIENPSPDVLDQVHSNLTGFARANARRHVDTLNADGASALAGGRAYTPSTFYANPFDAAARLGVDVLRNRTADALPGALAGGMYAGAESDEEPGSARWWADVGLGVFLGAVGSATFFTGARRTGITGKGGIADRGVDWAGRLLGKLMGRGPAELEALKQQQRLMRQLLDRQTGEIGSFLRDQFTPSERALMADLIENRGIVPELNRVHMQAQALDDYLTFVTQRMKEYGLLPPGIEEGGYLHRYYAKHLGLDRAFKEAKRQSLSGSYTIARGMVDTFGHEYMSPGAKALTDEMESLLREKSLLERGLYERAAKLRGAREVDSGAVLTLPDEAVLRAPPGNATTGGRTSRYPSMSVDAALERIEQLEELLRGLRKTELVEMVGEQNGKARSFFFTRDEVGRVESGVDPTLARLFRQAPAPAGAPRLTAPEGGIAPPPAPNMANLSPTDRAWTLHSTSRDGVKLRRDWTRRERDAWGEIRDAGYRFTRGMAEASHDLSLGKFFRDVSRRRDWASAEPKVTREGEWVQVPKGKARTGASLERYGALGGMYVRPDVWRAMKRYGVSPRVLGPLGELRLPGTAMTVENGYRAALSRWKLWHTVYNPVSHLNNTYSNVEMLYMAGYTPADLAQGIAELARGQRSQVWRDAVDAGLLDTDFGSAVLAERGAASPLETLAEQLRTQREDADASLAVDTMMRVKEWWISSKNAVESADSRWKSGLELARALAQPAVKGLSFIKKPVDLAAQSMRKAYRLEDNVFKLAVFAAERRAGRSVEQARQAANELFFDYNDLPDAVKFVRDFPIGSPFITYTYKAIPALVRNMVRRPERVLGLIMAYEAANYAALVHTGMDPDQYLETMDAYDESLPPWDGGRSLWGARNFVILPGGSNLLALGRSHAVGNPFMADAGERRAAVPGVTTLWGSDIFGGNPLHALYDVTVNEDWRGKPIYDDGAPDGTKRKAAAAYLWQSWAPSNILTPGSYHQQKVLDGLANDAREAPDGVAASIVDAANGVADALGLQRSTGLTRAGEEVDTGQALAGTFGVKVRDVQTDKAIRIEGSRTERKIKQAELHLDNQARLVSEGRLTREAFAREREATLAEIEKLRKERDELLRSRDTLKRQGLLERQRQP